MHGQSRAHRPRRRRPGAGQICKVCNQMAIGGALAGVSEAFALARKAGVDPARVREALLGGFAASRVLEVHGERILKGNYEPGFRTRLYQKDLRLANEVAAAQAGRRFPRPRVVTQLVERARRLRRGRTWITRRWERCCSSWRRRNDGGRGQGRSQPVGPLQE